MTTSWIAPWIAWWMWPARARRGTSATARSSWCRWSRQFRSATATAAKGRFKRQMSAVLLSGDLLVLSRVEAAAARAGITIRSAAATEQAVDTCLAEPAELLIVDLAAPQLEVDRLVREIKSRTTLSTRIIAFGPHVHEERLNAARDAGCDDVISRGQFFAQLDTILSRCAAK